MAGAPLDLPGLVVPPGMDPLRAWAERFPSPPKEAYVRFPRAGDVPLGAVQRLARRSQLTVDACPRDADDVLDLAVAGAHAVVAWMHEGGDVEAMAEAMGDGFLLGSRPDRLDAAVALVQDLGVPLLLEGVAAPPGVHGYLVDFTAQPLLLRTFGQWPMPETPVPEDTPTATDPGPHGAADAGGR